MRKIGNNKQNGISDIYYRRVSLIFILVNFITKIYLALRPLKFIDGLLIPDDAYLSLTIAKNIANGLGPLYGTEFTNGFQPLYVFLMAPVYFFSQSDFITPVHVALVILAIFDGLTLLYLFKFTKLYTDNLWSFIFLGLAWIFNINVLKNSVNGLETSVSVFFIVLTLYYFVKYRQEIPKDFKTHFIVGLFCGLAIFARIDNIFLLLSLIVVVFTNRGMVLINKVKNSAIMCFGALIIYLPWILYSYLYTGDVLPVSGKAVRYMSLAQVNHSPTWENWYSKILEKAFGVIFHGNMALIFIFLILSVVMAFAYREYISKKLLNQSIIPLIILFIFSICLFFSYSLYIFTFWFFERYFYPITLFFLVANTLIIGILNSSQMNKKILNIINISIITAVIAFNVSQESFTKIFVSDDDKNLGYMNAGLWCSKNFKDGMIIGSSQTGAIGYFANNLKVINLDGVVNKSCYESLVNKTNIEYIKKQKIQAIVGWKQNIEFIRTESKNFKESDLKLLGSIPEFKTRNYDWYVYKVVY